MPYQNFPKKIPSILLEETVYAEFYQHSVQYDITFILIYHAH